MTKIYSKDPISGIVAINSLGSVEYGTPGTQEFSQKRNADGRVYIPHNVAFNVIVRAKGKETIIASGVGLAPTTGCLCPVWVRVRQEKEQPEPKESEVLST